MNSLELVEHARLLLNELRPHNWSDAQLLALISLEEMDAAKRLLAKRKGYLSRAITVDFSIGTDTGDSRTIEMPENLHSPEFLEDIRSANAPVPIRLIYHADRVGSEAAYGERVWPEGLRAWRAGRTLGLTPKALVPAGPVVRITGAFFPPRLTISHPEAAETGGSSGLTIPIDAPGISRTSDYYNGARVAIVSGAATGTVRGIADYDGPTRRITISGTWGTALADTDQFATIPVVPDEHHELLAYGAAIRGAGVQESNREAYAIISGERNRLRAEFDAFLQLDRSSRPPRVRETQGGW